MKEFELTMRLRNNLIKKRRLELGLTPRECAERAGVGYGVYLEYEGLRRDPIDRSLRAKVLGASGETWKQSAVRLATFFGLLPEELFPEVIRGVKKPEVVAEMQAEQALALAKMSVVNELPVGVDEQFSRVELSRALDIAVSTLNPQERAVLQHRFARDETLEEIGQHFGLSQERIRQVETKALRKLRHPSRSAPLKAWIEK